MIPVFVDHALSDEHDNDSRTTVQPCFIILQEKQEIPIHIEGLNTREVET
jgi:hypothetical protein